ncbi:MAG: undecaprenyl-diphosphate phosphatase [Desulfobacteraceae bacterium]|nr:MAG: undecaprenyl-diphosphate phosphatase [Desulfobacteraceae bacterium]
MEPIQAVILGTIQGLAEFFPVSSSGHLVIFQKMMGLKEPALMFDICVHVGTLAAIFLYYFKDIQRMLASWGRSLFFKLTGKTGDFSTEEIGEIQMIWFIIAGCVPTAIIGAGLQRMADVLFSSLMLVAAGLFVTAGLLMLTRWKRIASGTGGELTLIRALTIGLVQGIAVVPGISRSGSTIVTGLLMGVHQDIAVRYSFLLSIPAILGALLLEVLTHQHGNGDLSFQVIAVGLMTSFVVGYGALSGLVKMVQKGRLYFFAPYCAVAGMVAIALRYMG